MYSRAEGIADHYWPRPVFYYYSSTMEIFLMIWLLFTGLYYSNWKFVGYISSSIMAQVKDIDKTTTTTTVLETMTDKHKSHSSITSAFANLFT